MRTSHRLALALLAACATRAPAAQLPSGILLADFEGDTYGDWTATGEAFGTRPATRAFYAQRLSGFVGKGLVNTFTRKKDRETGSLTSPPFAIAKSRINFLIGGGRHPGKTCINLLVDGKIVRTATGRNSDAMRWHSWDVRELKGKQATIQILDQVPGPWGHIDIDHIILSDEEAKGMGPGAVADFDPSNEFYTTFTYTASIGLGPEKGITRRDVSDAIKAGDRFYIWYTKTPRGPSGYDATVWYATSPDGKAWTERGEALARGGKGEWDEQSVFTPNILVAEGRYYLFYTSVEKPFTQQAHTAIGAAVADSPDGPWKKLPQNPILKTGKHGTWLPGDAPRASDEGEWDSHRVDDACLLVRGGKFWLYYKGRQMGLSPGRTKMGVAIAERPEGPYVKSAANPVLRGGHEVLVWPHGKGVAALVTAAGPPSVWHSPDGIRFTLKSPIRNQPHAAGAYRPDAFTNASWGTGILWGIAHRGGRGQMPYLGRFDCTLRPKAPGRPR